MTQVLEHPGAVAVVERHATEHRGHRIKVGEGTARISRLSPRRRPVESGRSVARVDREHPLCRRDGGVPAALPEGVLNGQRMRLLRSQPPGFGRQRVIGILVSEALGEPNEVCRRDVRGVDAARRRKASPLPGRHVT